MLTGGLPPCIDAPCAAAEAYHHLYPRVIAQNQKFYKRFPGDVAKVQRIITYLSEQPDGGLRLANGDHLTPRCVMLLGCNGPFCKAPYASAVTVVVVAAAAACCKQLLLCTANVLTAVLFTIACFVLLLHKNGVALQRCVYKLALTHPQSCMLQCACVQSKSCATILVASHRMAVDLECIPCFMLDCSCQAACKHTQEAMHVSSAT